MLSWHTLGPKNKESHSAPCISMVFLINWPANEYKEQGNVTRPLFCNCSETVSVTKPQDTNWAQTFKPTWTSSKALKAERRLVCYQKRNNRVTLKPAKQVSSASAELYRTLPGSEWEELKGRFKLPAQWKLIGCYKVLTLSINIIKHHLTESFITLLNIQYTLF